MHEHFRGMKWLYVAKKPWFWERHLITIFNGLFSTKYNFSMLDFWFSQSILECSRARCDSIGAGGTGKGTAVAWHSSMPFMINICRFKLAMREQNLVWYYRDYNPQRLVHNWIWLKGTVAWQNISNRFGAVRIGTIFQATKRPQCGSDRLCGAV